MSARTFVIGVGMTKFDKPGTKEGDYPDWAKEAGEKALADAGIPYEDVEQAYAGYCYGDSTYGQRALYQLGLTGIPVVNVNNNCSTGSSALFLARQAVRGGLVDCALALGFEKMEKGSLGVKYTDRTNALDKHAMAMFALRDPEESPAAPQMFGNAGRDHMEKYGSEPDHYAWIGWKNHKHSVNNPYAQFQDEYSLDEIKDGADDPRAADQAPVLADLRRLRLRDRRLGALRRRARALGPGGRDRRPGDGHRPELDLRRRHRLHQDRRLRHVAGRPPIRPTRRPGSRPDEVDVCELHDCFSANELITYEALGFAAEGEGHKLVEAEATTYGGDGPVVNPSGRPDLEGPPARARPGSRSARSSPGSCAATADARQVDGAEVALQHNIGLGGAAVVSVYKPAKA